MDVQQALDIGWRGVKAAPEERTAEKAESASALEAERAKRGRVLFQDGQWADDNSLTAERALAKRGKQAAEAALDELRANGSRGSVALKRFQR